MRAVKIPVHARTRVRAWRATQPRRIEAQRNAVHEALRVAAVLLPASASRGHFFLPLAASFILLPPITKQRRFYIIIMHGRPR